MKIKIRWGRAPRTKKWHVFFFFEGYKTLGSACTSNTKVPPLTELKLMPKAGERECGDCLWAAMAFTKRYRKIRKIKRMDPEGGRMD